MSKIINTGIIGFGIAGQVFHAPFIHMLPGFHLKKLSTTSPKNIAIAREAYPEAEIVSDAQSIIDDDAIELIIIGTPNTSHLPLAKAALLAGKHVLLEKPMTITSADADELIALAEKQNLVLTVNQNRRFDGTYRTVKKVIESKLLGNLVEYEAHYDRFRPGLKAVAWREEDLPGSGILYDLGAHLIDQALDLFGLPQEVYADVRIQRPGGKVDDHFEVILNYPGLKVTLKAGMLVKDPGPNFMLYGDKGSYLKYGADGQEAALKVGFTPATMPDWGVEPDNMMGSLNIECNGLQIKGQVKTEIGAYQDLFINTYQAILGKEELLIKAVQSRNIIRIIELAMQSSEQKATIPFSL
ncbi:MAG: Gfo/Idh/MocA family oxidoreductase [Sphingobacteriaceae bacterium]